MKNKMVRLTLMVFFLGGLIIKPLYGQDHLEKYIQEGLSNNIVLKQKNISLERAEYSLKIATSYFFPSVKLEADYTSGEGGRNIYLPVGDMLNPVYATLNQLTKSNRFPQIENVKVNLFPFHFYDVKLSAAMPVLNTDLIFNRKINDDQTHLDEYEVEAYKRELVKDIKTAYYNYLSAISEEKIYKSSLKVAEEGKRVNESLLKNGKGLPVYVLRSESEISELNSKITEAGNQAQNAKRYFNFILNKNKNDEIYTSFNIDLKLSEIDKVLTTNYDLSNREEIKMLETGKSMNESALEMKKLYWLPKINAFISGGAQDENWNYNSDSRYYLFGFQLSVPIFEAFRNSNKIQSAKLDLMDSQLSIDLTNKQIELSESIARNDLIAARQNYNTAVKEYETAGSYERLIENGYKAGTNTFIETVDARNQLTQAALMLNINTYKTLSALAKYEREIASDKINY